MKSMENLESTKIIDVELGQDLVKNEVLIGLSKSQKTLPPKLLYDKRGSEIFEKICLLKEYYPSRAEAEILKTFSGEISRLVGPDALIIEPGSGAGDKIRYLLPHLIEPAAFVPIEISREILIRMTEEFHHEFPSLKVIPICADFTKDISLPLSIDAYSGKKIIFFPGSTLGNFYPNEAVNFLKKFGDMIGEKGGIVIGVDLKKEPEIFKEAYDDPHGVTAAFNMNLLERLNREVNATFDLNNFKHEAYYNEKLGRVEMHLLSKIPQLVRVGDSMFRFKEGETIHTENSYKYTVEEMAELASKAKFKLVKYWKDSQDLFCVYYFERN